MIEIQGSHYCRGQANEKDTHTKKFKNKMSPNLERGERDSRRRYGFQNKSV